MKKILLMMLLLGNITIVLADGKTRFVDPTTFDIAGVKLGMSLDQATKAITTTLGIKKSQIEYPKYLSKNNITDRKEIEYFKVKTQSGVYDISLYPDISAKNKPLVVWKIVYKMAYTKENVKAMETAVVAKYGQATNNGWPLAWCNSDGESFCNNIFIAKLQYYDTTLELSDSRYIKAVQDYNTKKQNAVPAF